MHSLALLEHVLNNAENKRRLSVSKFTGTEIVRSISCVTFYTSHNK